MASGFVEVLKRNSLEVKELEGAHAEEFLKFLKQLRTELQDRVLSAGGLNASFNAFHIQRVLGETEAGILTLESKAIGKFDKAATEAVDLSIEHIGEELDRLSKAFDGASLDITLDAVKALTDPAQQLIASHFQSSVRRYGLDLLNGVRQRLQIALRTGDQFGQVVRDVAGEKGPLGLVGRRNAERLVRTETSGAYGAAQHSGLAQAAKQVPALKKVWLHIGSQICDVCMPLHGTERPLDGTWTIKQGRQTKKVAHAPAHPNCVCRVTGMKSSWREKMQGLGYLSQNPDSAKSSPAQL